MIAMGYTHYWSNAEFTAEQWSAMQAAARTIVRRSRAAGIRLRSWTGTGPLCIDADEISLNGDDKTGTAYESFRITRAPCDGDFCKTARRPYDATVVALLIVAARIGPLTWSSDGDAADHSDGEILARRLP
jgi:hypothetical protein